MIVALAPAVSVPSAQGKAPVQAPLVDTKLSPAGVGSATDTLAASLGPLLVTVIVYATLEPGTRLAGPVKVRWRSAAAALTATEAVCASSPGLGSLVTEVAEAVLRIGFAPAYPDGTW